MVEQPKGQETTAPPDQGQEQQAVSPEETKEQSPEEILESTGFKSVGDLAKSYKEAQAKMTKSDQARAQLEKALQESAAAQGYQQQQMQPPSQPRGGQGSDFWDDPVENVQRIVQQNVGQAVNDVMRQFEAKQAIQNVRSENQERFDTLQPILQQIYAEKPHLNNLGESGLRMALDEAQERRTKYLQELVTELDGVRGQGQSSDGTASGTMEQQIREKVVKDMKTAQTASVPGSNAGRAIGSDDVERRKDAVSKGDVDALLDLKFKKLQ